MDHETRLLIDGQLVDAESGKTFDNVNPATEEVLGPVADASARDMQSAIDAARRAFDGPSWATDPELRKRVPAPAPGRARQARGKSSARS